MPKLYLVRHLEPEGAGRLLGASDPPLAPGARFAGNLEAEIIYSSPLRRARQTALQLGDWVEILPELAEIGLGAWEGLTWAEVEQQDPALAAAKLKDWFSVIPPGGEPYEPFRRRVARAVDRFRLGPFPAVAVAHLAVNAEIGRILAGHNPAVFRQFYGEVFEYEL
ncbi:MAG: histidine phosphatase family protein [Acidobacteria bacterium]|nr:histidine phosphatase family protein [Acidobacteriota bacterium]